MGIPNIASLEGETGTHALDAETGVVADVVQPPFALPISPRSCTRLLGAVRRPPSCERERRRVGTGPDSEMAEAEAEIRQEGARTLEVLLPSLGMATRILDAGLELAALSSARRLSAVLGLGGRPCCLRSTSRPRPPTRRLVRLVPCRVTAVTSRPGPLASAEVIAAGLPGTVASAGTMGAASGQTADTGRRLPSGVARPDAAIKGRLSRIVASDMARLVLADARPIGRPTG